MSPLHVLDEIASVPVSLQTLKPVADRANPKIGVGALAFSPDNYFLATKNGQWLRPRILSCFLQCPGVQTVWEETLVTGFPGCCVLPSCTGTLCPQKLLETRPCLQSSSRLTAVRQCPLPLGSFVQ